MNITYCRDYESMSLLAGSLVISEIEKKKNLLLCGATGNSTHNLYQELVNKSKTDKTFFEELRILKLDEWGGLPKTDPVSCEHYLRTKLLDHLEISSERYISFDSNPSDPVEECKRIQSLLDQQGPIDICLLGLGKNGHIGFNEPGSHLEPFCHVADLSEESLQHSMIQNMDQKPKFGLTLGMKDILDSRKIIFLITGKGKEQVIEKLLQRKVSVNLPASFLWLHNNVECVIDQSVFSKT